MPGTTLGLRSLFHHNIIGLWPFFFFFFKVNSVFSIGKILVLSTRIHKFSMVMVSCIKGAVGLDGLTNGFDKLMYHSSIQERQNTSSFHE